MGIETHLFSLFVTKASSRCYSFFPFEGNWCHTHWPSWGPGLWWRCLYEHVAQGFRTSGMLTGDSSRVCHCFVTIALDWLEWRKNYCEARYSFKFSPEHKSTAQGLLFTKLHFPLGGCLATGTWEALACAARVMELKVRRIQAEADSPVPWIITLRVQMLPNPSASAPFWEVSQQFVTFLHLPSFSVSHPVSEQTWQIPRALKSRWKIQSRDWVYLQFLSENEGKREERRRAWLLMCSLVS